MPNYKLCRFCTEKFIQQTNERICSKCEKDVVRAVSMPTGEPVYVNVESVPPINPAISTATTDTPIIDKETVNAVLNEKIVIPAIPDPSESDEALLKAGKKILQSKEVVDEPEVVEIVKEEIVEPTAPESKVPQSPEEDRIQKDVINPTED